MNINNLFNEKLDIILQNDKTINIKRKKVLIHESPILYGEANIGKHDNNIYIIKEVYSFEDKRLRYSYDKYEDAKCYETIEIDKDGNEYPIFVIESFSKKETLIGSLGNIKKINSDKTIRSNDKSLILKLLRKNRKEQEDINSLVA